MEYDGLLLMLRIYVVFNSIVSTHFYFLVRITSTSKQNRKYEKFS